MVAIPLNTLTHMGIGLRKGDPLLGFFNYYVQKFKEAGILALLKYREKEISDSEFKEEENPVYAFSMQNVFVVFNIFMIGLGIRYDVIDDTSVHINSLSAIYLYWAP
ncbi:uncharacterized protein LOC111643676 [Copidosoma floridanum]|uniref:uncharacterized protein LOC111643676 n=1 Tax=Copidosoma floridanum TaxID=29053 RepID=UPI000C6FA385|nr:uncharacterized protein LOC111643676 [Copidosoma floridanum]